MLSVAVKAFMWVYAQMKRVCWLHSEHDYNPISGAVGNRQRGRGLVVD